MRDYKIRTALRSGTLRREGLFATAPTLLSGRFRAALHPERRADPGDNYKGHSRNVENEKARPSGLALIMVGLPGVEPGTNGLCVPATVFTAPFGFVVWTVSCLYGSPVQSLHLP